MLRVESGGAGSRGSSAVSANVVVGGIGEAVHALESRPHHWKAAADVADDTVMNEVLCFHTPVQWTEWAYGLHKQQRHRYIHCYSERRGD